MRRIRSICQDCPHLFVQEYTVRNAKTENTGIRYQCRLDIWVPREGMFFWNDSISKRCSRYLEHTVLGQDDDRNA